MADQNYSPKLRVAMKEVEAILSKHDIGGVIALTDGYHNEFKLALEPSWSLLRFIRNGDAVHIKIHQSKQPYLDMTGSMVFNLRDMAGLFFTQLDQMVERIRQHAKVDHTPFGPKGINNDDRDGA